MRKARGKYWVDENNNFWSIENYTEEQAEQLSLSLVGCRYCVNCECCEYCEYCNDCWRSSFLTDCIVCYNRSFAEKLVGAINVNRNIQGGYYEKNRWFLD